MTEQQTIGDVGDPTPQGPRICRWCSRPGTHEVEVEPQRKQKDKRTNTFDVIPAVMAPACQRCFNRIEHHKAEALRQVAKEKAALARLGGKAA